MLLSFCLWLYITLICFTWGIIVCRFFTRGENIHSILFPHVSMICLLGLSATGTLALYFSLYLPVSWIVHLIMLLPVIACWSSPLLRRIMWRILSTSIPVSTTGKLLLAVLVLMIVSIASNPIIHPDTLSYHFQSIRWFEQFRVVPGLANVDTELGMQSLWFAANALFRLEFSNEHAALFLNGAVLGWFFVYVCTNITTIKSFTIALIFLLCFTLLSWTQVRLTAASASPDFIVVLYILAAAGLYVQSEQYNRLTQMTIISFAVTAIAIKMSALVIVLLPLVMIISFLIKRQYKSALRGFLLCVILLTPVLVRTTIATGYPLFPSSIFSLDVEWKYPAVQLEEFRNYIREYARSPSENVSASGWIRTWWSRLAPADQVLMIIVALSLLLLLVMIRKVVTIIRSRELILLLIAITGAIVWWLMAPDPRFGTAYLLLIVLLSAKIFSRTYFPPQIKKHAWLNAAIVLIIICVGGYTAYRFTRFSQVKEIVYPSGISHPAFATALCKGVPVNYPVRDTLCGSIPAPCIPDTCQRTVPIGSSIEEGFRKK